MSLMLTEATLTEGLQHLSEEDPDIAHVPEERFGPPPPGRRMAGCKKPYRGSLMKVPGIGRWIADIYLMEVLCRPDILPVDDLALARAVQKAKKLDSRPTPGELAAIGLACLHWHAFMKGYE